MNQFSSAFALLLFALAAQAADPLNVVSTSGQTGQVLLLSSERQSLYMSDNVRAITGAGRELALLYLDFFPEALGQPNDPAVKSMGGQRGNGTEKFAQLILRDEWVALRNVRGDPIKLAAERERLWKKLKSLSGTGPRTLQVYYPVQLNAQAFDAAKGVFPVYGRSFSVSQLSAGRRGAVPGCIELDRKFDLKEFPVAAGEAEKFLETNRDRPQPTFGAKVFIGVRATVTGKTEAKPGRPVKCPLTARIDAIEGYEFKGLEMRRYAVESASPGARINTFYDGTDAAAQPAEAKVTTPFKAQTVPTTASADARTFELATKNGLVLLSPREALRNSVLLSDLDAIENLKTYADFLALRMAPAMYKTPGASLCLARYYLKGDELRPYFTGQGNAVQWQGANEFEQKRAQQAFYDQAIPRLAQRASATPQRFLVVAREQMPEYDFTLEGFRFGRLTPSSTTQGLFGRCGIQQAQVLTGDRVEEFWPVPPAQAEATLLKIPTDPQYPGRNIRYVYVAGEVEVIMVPPDVDERFAVQAKIAVIYRPLAVTVYQDIELTKPLFTPKRLTAGRSVLETGPDGRKPGATSYQGQVGPEGDLLQNLQANGDLSAEQWAQLSHQQVMRDEEHYKAFSQAWNATYQNPAVPFVFKADYVPFFPNGFYRVSPTGRPYDGLPDEYQAWFRAWSKQLAAAY